MTPKHHNTGLESPFVRLDSNYVESKMSYEADSDKETLKMSKDKNYIEEIKK